MANLKHITHLYARAGFGITPAELQAVRSKTKEEIVEALFADAEQIMPLQIHFDMPHRKDMRMMSRADKNKIKSEGKDLVKELNTKWAKQMGMLKAALREKMTFFWHGHFACKENNPNYVMGLNNALRGHALGQFRNMVMSVAAAPAMIKFLNNQQNKKSHPNENFARELMELFTLGRDKVYTEKDIQEAARAFTGWQIDGAGNFIFNERIHDFGQKQFLGQTGDFNGNDIVRIILEQPQSANYIVSKIWRFFVSDEIDPDKVAALGKQFYDSGYDIGALMKTIFASDWFYDPKYIGNKIKSPIELLVGFNRQFDLQYGDPVVMLRLQRLLGQVLFDPPNVAGWPGGKQWIDSSSLMLRLKMASVLLNNGIIEVPEKDELTEADLMRIESEQEYFRKRVKKSFNVSPNWQPFLDGLDPQWTKADLTQFLIQPELTKASLSVLKEHNMENKKALIVAILSLPEYQLC